ncbi:MAG: hypothetical protein EOM80_11475 [Erysipelotrichia bacterium]|nr:hypothetical protein [Erysipelotrichia bacterium]
MLNLKKLVAWLSGTDQPKRPSTDDSEERRRFQRLQLDNCFLSIDDSDSFPVTNLSYGGFRVDLSGWKDLKTLQPGDSILCNLKMQNTQINCRVTARNISKTIIGCAFSELTQAQSNAVTEFIKPRILGHSLREIDTAKLKNDDPKLRMRWFQGDDSTQIFFWQTVDGENVMQEFYFLDYFISWNKASGGLQTGKIKTESRSNFGRISPDSVAFFHIPPYKALKLGQTILECSKLPPEARDNLLSEIIGEEKRLFHRFIVKNSAITFVADNSCQVFPLLNISMNGMALLKPEEASINTEHPLRGVLKTGDTDIKIIFKPAYFHETMLGGGLQTIDQKDLIRLEEFLAPRLLAQYLEEVPAPVEPPAFAPLGARTYLYTGLHNTHILSLIDTGASLLRGRIAFMDRAITCRRGNITEYRCPEGLIFPGDWELDSAVAQPIEKVEEIALQICREMIANAELAPEVKQAWEKAFLGKP